MALTRCRLLHRGLVHFRSGGGKLSFLGKSMMAGQQLLHRVCFFCPGIDRPLHWNFLGSRPAIRLARASWWKEGISSEGGGGEACKRGAKKRKGEVGQNPVQSVSTKKVSIDISFLPS